MFALAWFCRACLPKQLEIVFLPTCSPLIHMKLSSHLLEFYSLRKYDKPLQTSLVGICKSRFISLVYCLKRTHFGVCVGFGFQNLSEEKNSMSEPERPLPSHPKNDRHISILWAREAWPLTGRRYWHPIRSCHSDFFTGSQSCCFPPRPTSHLLRTHSWVSDLTAATPWTDSAPTEACRRMFRKWLPLFTRDIPTCWSST